MAQRTNETIEEYRARRRAEEQRRRDNPETNERIRANQRARYANGGRERQRAYYQRLRTERFFHWRARLWSNRWSVAVTEQQLHDLWQGQDGRCALSGRDLGPDAHLDHITPVADDGDHTITNLRWLDPLVNVALGRMSDEEFLSLCREVVQTQERPS